MALRRTKKNSQDDDELLDEEEEEVEEDETEDEEDEPERAFPTWIKVVSIGLGLLIAVGVGAYGGYAWEKKHLEQHDVVATINNVPITLDYLRHRMDMAAGNNTAHTVAQETLLLQYAAKEGALPSDQDVETRYKEMSKDSTKFTAELIRTHQDPNDVKRSIRLNMARTALLTKGVTVTEIEVQNYYKANIDLKNPNAQFARPDTAVISVIVTRSKDAIDKANADLQAGQPFATIAAKYSEDNSKANGGLLPAIKRGQPGLEKSPELAKIIFSLKPKEKFGPQQLGSGNTRAWWIIVCNERQDAVTLPFDRVRDAAYKGTLLAKGQSVNGAKVQEGLTAFQASSQIQVLNNWATFSDAITSKSTETR